MFSVVRWLGWGDDDLQLSFFILFYFNKRAYVVKQMRQLHLIFKVWRDESIQLYRELKLKVNLSTDLVQI